MRHAFFLVGIAVLLSGASHGLAAQQIALGGATQPSAASDAAVKATPPVCTYDACALRVEPSFNGPRLVRGTAGSLAASLGGLRPTDLSQLFVGNDSASAYSLRYVRAERVNRLATYSGIVLAAVGLAQSNRMNGFTAAGYGALLVSIPYQVAAERGLSRAVWWYNATLPVTPSNHE